MVIYVAVVLHFCSSLIGQTPGSVALTWTWSQGDDAVATGFNVKRGSTAGGPHTIVASLTGTAIRTYTDASGMGNILSPHFSHWIPEWRKEG
jgi:hypothetical protein